ncbi:MAG: Gfo/Idh/MocA family oxidoreductase [Phycisphaeraceae bacterium]|nr:Gfo/Idh/MocA family oxidoreductase [Phycisphaeraceae bacterium]
MKDSFNIAGIGLGGIWKAAHAQPWLDHPNVQIVAGCDTNPEKLKPAKELWGMKTLSEDYRDIIKLKEVDVVDICTPNVYHSEIAIAALEAGKHVFCEKPDAVNAAEARKMADAAKASGKTLMVMRNNRFRPDARYIKRLIGEGKMGEVYTGRCGWIRRRGIPGKGGWFTTKALSGGGPLIDLGVHMIDLAMWLMGSPKPVAVTGSTYTKFAESDISESIHSSFGEKQADGTFDVEDLAIGFIKFENGASLQIEFSWASNIGKEMSFVELRGTKAGCKLGGGPMEIYGEESGALLDVAPVLPKEKLGGHAANLHHFVDVLMGRAKPDFVPEQGVHMIGILSAIYESAATGKEVSLK